MKKRIVSITASLGYSVYSTEPWDGLSVLDPFHTAKAVVSFVVEDANSLKFDVILNLLKDSGIQQLIHYFRTFQNSKSFQITGNDFYFADSIYSKVLDHSHLAVNIDLVNQHDEIETVIGEIEKSKLSGKNQLLSSKDKGDKEFLDQIAYLQGLSDIVSAKFVISFYLV